MVFVVVVGGEQEQESAREDARVLGDLGSSLQKVPETSENRVELSKALDACSVGDSERRLSALIGEQ